MDDDQLADFVFFAKPEECCLENRQRHPDDVDRVDMYLNDYGYDPSDSF